MAVADGKQDIIEVPDAETILEADKDTRYETQTAARKSALPEVVSSPVAEETMSRDKMQQESYSGLSVPYMTAANLPHPVHGYETYMKYLSDSLRYPETALKEGIEGQVIITFTVGTDSIPRRISVDHPIGHGCDEEAIRLIREGPPWIPAVTGGNAVESEMKLPIRFSLPAKQDK